MPANTKMLKYDVDKKPSPQYFDPVLDEYGYLLGANGASRHVLYGADGEPVTTSGNKLAVRANEIEAQLTAIQGYIDGLEPAIGTPAADPAANTMLARLKTLATLIGEVQATPTANTLLARLKALETKIDAIIADGVKLSGRNIEEVKLVDEVEIRDIAFRVVSIPSSYLKKYKDWDLIIRNSHNNYVAIDFLLLGVGTLAVIKSDGSILNLDATVAANTHYRIGNAYRTPLSIVPVSTNGTVVTATNISPWKLITTSETDHSLRYGFHTTPTSGKISIFLRGVLN